MGEFALLISSTIGISLLHTLTGPDHYLPFIALSRSGKWSITKTVLWTSLCGLAHVGSSLLIGLLGIFLGWTLSESSFLETSRASFASWFLLLFGLGYTIYGLYCIKQNRLHKHFEVKDDAEIYVYEHRDGESVLPNEKFKVTPYVLFFIFALGPSEPILPLLFYPSANHSISQLMVLIIVYTAATLLVMVGMVLLGYFGTRQFNFPNLEKYTPFVSGLVVLVCGIGMVFLEW